MAAWTFLTNHAHALIAIAEDPGVRIEDIAQRVGITQRAAHRIVSDLEEGGYITRTRVGRRNQYELHADVPLRHPMDHGRAVSQLLALLRVPIGTPASATAKVPPA